MRRKEDIGGEHEKKRRYRRRMRRIEDIGGEQEKNVRYRRRT